MRLIATTIMSLFMLVSNGTDGQAASASGTSQTAPVQNSQTIKIARSGSQQPGNGPYAPGTFRDKECTCQRRTML